MKAGDKLWPFVFKQASNTKSPVRPLTAGGAGVFNAYFVN